MKALSLKQPYASLVVTGAKKIELRNWKTNHRGEFLVHASKVPIKSDFSEFLLEKNLMPLGAIVGKASLYHVKKYSSVFDWTSDIKYHLAGPEFQSSSYGFILTNPVKFKEPIPCEGALNFWDVPEPIMKQVELQLC